MIFKKFEDMTISEVERAFAVSTDRRKNGFPDECIGITFLLLTNRYMPETIRPYKSVPTTEMGLVKQDIMNFIHLNNRKSVEDAIAYLISRDYIYARQEKIGSFNYTIYCLTDSFIEWLPGGVPVGYEDRKLHVSLHTEFSMAGFNDAEKDIMLLLFLRGYSDMEKYYSLEPTKEWIAEMTGLSIMQVYHAIRTLIDNKIISERKNSGKLDKVYSLTAGSYNVFRKRVEIHNINFPIIHQQYAGPEARLWMKKKSISGLEQEIKYVLPVSGLLEQHKK